MDDSLSELKQQWLEISQEIERRLSALTEQDLAKPATWRGQEFTVRFLAHRFSGHARDHALQVRKARRALGMAPTEAQMILAQVAEARAQLLGECIGLSAEAVERAPAEGEWSVKQVIQHTIEVERRYLDLIEAALGRKPVE